jgi:hypothetical protein
MEASSKTTLPIDEYAVLKATIENKSNNVVFINSISGLLNMPQHVVSEKISNLDKHGLLVNRGKDIYQINGEIPPQLRYVL